MYLFFLAQDTAYRFYFTSVVLKCFQLWKRHKESDPRKRKSFAAGIGKPQSHEPTSTSGSQRNTVQTQHKAQSKYQDKMGKLTTVFGEMQLRF